MTQEVAGTPDPTPEMLVIWSRGGGGHKAAGEAIRDRVTKDGVDYSYQDLNGNDQVIQHGPGQVKDYDMMGKELLNADDTFLGCLFRCFTGKNIGDYCVEKWDSAQKRGDIDEQKQIVSQQWIAELLFHWIVYFKVRDMLREMVAKGGDVYPKVIVSTQALCTNAIAQAILKVNGELRAANKSEIVFHHYMTDMPTELSTHFYRSIAPIGKNEDLNRIYKLFVSSAANMRDEDQAVLNKHCKGINVEWLSHDQFPIRKAFLDTAGLNEQLDKPVVDINIKLHAAPADITGTLNPVDGSPYAEGTIDETALLQTGMSSTNSSPAQIEGNTATFKVKENDKVGFLMLGSQPTKQAVLDWINSMVLCAQKKNQSGIDSTVQHYFYVFCGAPEGVKEEDGYRFFYKNELYREVGQHLAELKAAGKLPNNFNVIPFTFQDADQLALLEARADLTITRSGGSTCFELIHLAEAASEGTIPQRPNRISIIHSEGMHKGDVSKYKSKEARQLLIAMMLGMAAKIGDIASSISAQEWEVIRNEVIHLAIQEGLTKSEIDDLQNFLTNAASGEKISNDQLEVLGKLSNALEAHLSVKNAIPLTEEEKEQLIAQKVTELRSHSDNEGMADGELRNMAIQLLLIEQGIPLWEAGNANYYIEVLRRLGATAKVSNPEYSQACITEKFFGVRQPAAGVTTQAISEVAAVNTTDPSELPIIEDDNTVDVSQPAARESTADAVDPRTSAADTKARPKRTLAARMQHRFYPLPPLRTSEVRAF